MSVDDAFDDDDEENRPSQKVTDDEGTVDEAVKRRILKARERIDDAEQALYVDAPVERNITPGEQHLGYMTIVRQYIRAIKLLLTSSKIPRAQYYYTEVLLAEEQVAPPAGSKNWSRFAVASNEQALKREMGLPSRFDPPSPKTVRVQGLGRVLRDDMATLSWEIDLHSGQDAFTETEQLTRKWPFEKWVFDAAVESADAFLQEAGIGLEIGHRETDDPEEGAF